MQFVVFLRGVNVGGHHKIKMADLRAALTRADFTSVQTYIQSGNIVLESVETNAHVIAQRVEQIICDQFGFQIPTVCFTHSEVDKMIQENPFQGAAYRDDRLYFALLFEKPAQEKVALIDWSQQVDEEIHYQNRVVYHSSPEGASRSKWNHTKLGNKLGVQTTTRNLRTMQKLVEMFTNTIGP